jgi:hypothetical protein
VRNNSPGSTLAMAQFPPERRGDYPELLKRLLKSPVKNQSLKNEYLKKYLFEA